MAAANGVPRWLAWSLALWPILVAVVAGVLAFGTETEQINGLSAQIKHINAELADLHAVDNRERATNERVLELIDEQLRDLSSKIAYDNGRLDRLEEHERDLAQRLSYLEHQDGRGPLH